MNLQPLLVRANWNSLRQRARTTQSEIARWHTYTKSGVLSPQSLHSRLPLTHRHAVFPDNATPLWPITRQWRNDGNTLTFHQRAVGRPTFPMNSRRNDRRNTGASTYSFIDLAVYLRRHAVLNQLNLVSRPEWFGCSVWCYVVTFATLRRIRVVSTPQDLRISFVATVSVVVTWQHRGLTDAHSRQSWSSRSCLTADSAMERGGAPMIVYTSRTREGDASFREMYSYGVQRAWKTTKGRARAPMRVYVCAREENEGARKRSLQRHRRLRS